MSRWRRLLTKISSTNASLRYLVTVVIGLFLRFTIPFKVLENISVWKFPHALWILCFAIAYLLTHAAFLTVLLTGVIRDRFLAEKTDCMLSAPLEDIVFGHYLGDYESVTVELPYSADIKELISLRILRCKSATDSEGELVVRECFRKPLTEHFHRLIRPGD